MEMRKPTRIAKAILISKQIPEPIPMLIPILILETDSEPTI